MPENEIPSEESPSDEISSDESPSGGGRPSASWPAGCWPVYSLTGICKRCIHALLQIKEVTPPDEMPSDEEDLLLGSQRDEHPVLPGSNAAAGDVGAQGSCGGGGGGGSGSTHEVRKPPIGAKPIHSNKRF